jgi:hypothetical protein
MILLGMPDRLGTLFAAVIVMGVAAVPILVATGVAPHWFWILF